jgi:hypothetical protein
MALGFDGGYAGAQVRFLHLAVLSLAPFLIERDSKHSFS